MARKGKRHGQALPREHFSSDHSPVAWEAQEAREVPGSSTSLLAEPGSHWTLADMGSRHLPSGAPAGVPSDPLAFPQPQGPPSSALHSHACIVATVSQQVCQPLPTSAPGQSASRLRESCNPFFGNSGALSHGSPSLLCLAPASISCLSPVPLRVQTWDQTLLAPLGNH